MGIFPIISRIQTIKRQWRSIREAVLREQADLGIIFDTDVDRSAVVTGEPLNRNNMIAVLSKIILAEHPGTRIVTNSPTSNHLKTFIEALEAASTLYFWLPQCDQQSDRIEEAGTGHTVSHRNQRACRV